MKRITPRLLQHRRRLLRQGSSLAALVILTAGGTAAAQLPAAAETAGQHGTTYYVDPATGDDGDGGTAPAQAWKSLDKVNATTFHAGDTILLRAGATWKGQLWPKGSGTASSPITVGSYGKGPKPAIEGDGQVADAVRLWNQEYWELRNLDVSNTVPATGTPGENLRDLRGIHVSGDDSEQLDHFVIDGVDVHDVSGQVNWIGGSVSDNAPGVHFKTGWDGSKRTGGIVFDTTVPDIKNPPATPTVLNDLTVENSTVRNTSFAGIIVKQYTGDGTNEAGETIATPTGWGTRASATDARFAPHTNVTIRGNYLTQADTEYGCDGIYLTNVRGATVERNVVDRTGTSGIETYYADDVTVQHNEVYRTEQKAGGADSNGIDADKGTTGVVIQYNFVHDNGDGLLLCEFAFGNVTVRYNVISGNSRYPVYLHSDKAATAEVYNNTVYNTTSDHVVYGYGDYLKATYHLRNNAFYSSVAGAGLTGSPTTTYDNNFYGGAALPVPDSDTHALTGDPRFVSPGVTGPYGTPQTGPQLGTALGFAPQKDSPLVGSGVAVPDNGGQDYRGVKLYRHSPDIGAVEQ